MTNKWIERNKNTREKESDRQRCNYIPVNQHVIIHNCAPNETIQPSTITTSSDKNQSDKQTSIVEELEHILGMENKERTKVVLSFGIDRILGNYEDKTERRGIVDSLPSNDQVILAQKGMNKQPHVSFFLIYIYIYTLMYLFTHIRRVY